MSGIVGIVQFDGSPVEPRLLRALTASLTFRGPDGQQTWIKDSIGFGHTLFKTTEESERDCQPLTLDGRSWIVADARIDAREDLFAALTAAGEPGMAQASWTDAELILRAYRCWDTACVDYLRGDFAFGIWDDARQQLFCARDHMGVKPFYYAQMGSSVIFSNTLDCVRRHRLVSDRLNELAIADFLLFGHNQDPATTSLADINRIPPAHCAVWSRYNSKTWRYWSMPIDEPLLYGRPDDYIDHFHDLLRKSVGDRLRTNQVWVFMSGGVDSPTLAATARDLMRERSTAFDLRALTKIDSFVPEEARHAGAVAHFLSIPIHYRQWTEDVDSRWERTPFSTPEPVPHAWVIPAEDNSWRQMKIHSRVFFYGEGPDNALSCEYRSYLACFSYLLERCSFYYLVCSIMATLIAERRPPFWGRISRRLTTDAYAHNTETAYPQWLNPSFATRLDLRARWSAVKAPPPSPHPYRPNGYMSLQIPLWQAMFESLDSGVTKKSFEVRHPFVDVRMLSFLLAVPCLPWCRSKYLLRRSMRGKLPGVVLYRRKATGNQHLLDLFWAGLCESPFLPTCEIHEYIDIHRFLSLPMPANIEDSLRVRSLNHWLQNSHQSSHNPCEGPLCDRSAR